jgi:tetratricopeptide (TPR) repeat protein
MIRRSLTFTVWALLVARPTLGGQATAPAASPSPDYAQEAYVIEQSRTTWRFENDGTGRRDSYLRVKVQSEAGVQSWGQLAFPYSSANERMDVVFVRVLKADGTVVTASADAVQDLSSAVQREAPVYTDTREKHITVPGLRPGEVLEVALATVVHTPLARGHFWTEHEFIKSGVVLDDRLLIDAPGERKITLKARSGLEQTMTERDGRRIYEWHTSRLISDQGSAKGEQDVQRKPRKPEPSAVRLTTFASWEELGRWYGDLERTQRTPSPEIRKKAAELTADRATDLEKLEALYEYVATNFRYVSLSFGVGRYQPHAAADVLHNQYGDCKDKHTLLASLSESIGLHASAALIHSAIELDPDFPSPSQFDHVITRVAVGSDAVWLDATTEVAPFRLLSPSLRKKQTLVVDGSGAARLEETPAAAPMPNATAADIDSTLSESSTLSTHVRLTFSGDDELLMRSIFRRAPNAEWKTLLSGLSDRGGLGGEITDWTVSDPAALREPFTIEYHVTKANFITWTKKQVELELPLSTWIGAPRDGSDTDATSPLELGSVRQSTYKIRIELPTSFVGHAPLPVSMKRDYAEYRADYKLDGHLFTAERSLSFRSPELPSARRGDYAAFTRAVSGDLRQSLALESRVAAAVSPSGQLNVKELYKSGSDAIDSFHYAQAVTLLKRAVELEPTHGAAWTNLGRAYMGLHQTDAAIDAFRKQIDVNAYDLYAYNNLGVAYRSQQKLHEAETAFLKQIEIDPLNKFAHESLGGLYLDQHNYDAAAPELEKAIALSPQNANLRVRLGGALLNLREPDRARSAFTRAVELDPSPLTWNDIAYRLALNGTDLELAQRYAESAVAATTAASRTVSIDHVTVRDLWQVGSMASHWDTLGWVHVAKGDIDRAEKLVGAAWRLLQNAEVGDHLAQIYEKQGRREDAIRTYALAMTAERPDPKIRERLAVLLGGADRADTVAQKCRDQLQNERTIALDGTGPAGAAADFFVLLDNRSGRAAVESVTFISGDEALRRLADALPRANYDATFPDASPAKILRRGTLSCASSDRPASCRFIMMLPAEAQAAQQP